MSGKIDIDLDVLADYAAGLLERAQRADVDRLVATDPAWARAFAALTVADPNVRADLAALGATSTPMPVDVVARIDAEIDLALAFARAGRRGLYAARRRAASTRPGLTRRRWVAAVAVAAGVAAFAALGVPALRDRVIVTDLAEPQRNSARDEGAGAAGAPAPVPPSQLFGADGPTITASGTDYQRQFLATDKRSTEMQPGSAPGGDPLRVTGAVPPELNRLANPVALRDCLAAISTVHPGRATSVDYARFEGAPALIVVIVTAPPAAVPATPGPTNASRILAVGPACGAQGAGADIRYASG